MPEINPDEYFASKLSSVDLTKKLTDLAQASRTKADGLRAMHSEAAAVQAQKIAAQNASDASLVGKLGLEAGSFIGNRVNDVASVVSGASRLLGQVVSLPVNAAGMAVTVNATKQDYKDYNNRGNAWNPADPAVTERLNEPAFAGSTSTMKDAFDTAGKLRGVSRAVNNFFDLSGIVEQTNRDSLNKDMGEGFQKNWDKVTGGWDAGKHGDFAKAGAGVVSGVAGLLLNAGEAVITNPSAVREYVVENAPQLFVGAAGKVGQAAMAASNMGYAADNYQQGIENYAKKNNGALPPAEERQRMAVLAASLAVAEHAGDHLGLEWMKAAKAEGGDLAATGFKAGVKNTAKAASEGFGSEALTEGYQTWGEGEITGKPASAQDIYNAGVIGGASGAGLSGAGHAVAEIKHATPAHAAQAEDAANAAATFQAAAQANDTSVYMDPASRAYDPSKAVGVLLSHAMHPDTTDTVKQANLKQAGEIVSQLEEKHAQTSEFLAARSPEALNQIKSNIDYVNTTLKATDPADTAKVTALNAVLTNLNTDLVELSDGKRTMAANTELSKLDRQLTTSRARLEGLTTVAEPRATPADVSSLVTQINDGIPVLTDRVDSGATSSATASTAPASTPAEKLLVLSMTQPDALTGEQAQALADNKDNTLTPEQRDHLRAFSAARIAENTLSTMGKVSQEVLYGSKQNVGIAQYKDRITAAITANSAPTAQRQLDLLQKFADDHKAKATVAREAMKQGLGSQIVKTATGWAVQPAEARLTDKQIRANGGLTLNSARLVSNIQTEADALAKAVTEMQSATSLKFGLVAKQSAGVQSNSTAATPESPASLFREKREREGRVEVDKSTSPESTPKADPHTGKTFTGEAAARQYIQTNKLGASHRVVNTGRNEYTLKEKTSTVDAKAAREERQAALDKQAATIQAAVDKQAAKTAAAKQPASVSEAPAVEAATSEAVGNNPTLAIFDEVHDTSAPYTQQNLVAVHFKQNTDGRHPLASVKDFLTSLKNTDQVPVVQHFMASAAKWFPTIKANLVKTNKDYHYTDLMQALINDSTDLDENVKTAIAYAAYSWIAENVARPAFNTSEEINLILGRGEDALVATHEAQALEHVGTRQNVVVNALGQRAVAALGLKSLASAPRNLQADLESAIGTHAMKLLMDAGILTRATISGKEMAALTRSKDTDTNVPFYFLQLTRKDGVMNPAALDIFETSKGTQGALDNLFSVEPALKEPSQTPVKSTQKTTRNTDQAIPAPLAKMVANDDAMPSFVRQDMYNLASQVDPETMLAIAGVVDVDTSVHKSRRKSLEAKNDGLKRELERFMGYVGQMGADVVMHFEHSVWKQQRVGIATNLINPQTSKIHRHMLYRQSWENTVEINDAKSIDNFRLRVAEGLGVKTDKMSEAKAMAAYQQLLAKPEIKGAVAVLVKTLNGTDGKLSANDQQVLIAGVQAGGSNMHSLDALMALAQYSKAVKAGDTSFTTQMMAEVDGVTNGPMFSHLLLGAAGSVKQMFALLNKGGFFEQGSTHTEYNTWRDAPDHFDLYETTAGNMHNAVLAAGFNGKLMASIYAFTGDLVDSKGVTKAGRNIIKTPLTAMVFGSSVKSAVESMADKFVDAVYLAIEDSTNNKKGALTAEQLRSHLGNLGVQIAAGTDLMEYEFHPGQVNALKGTFTDTIGKAVETTMKEDFAVFIEQRKQFNLTAQLAFEIYNAAYTGMREAMIAKLVASGEIAVNPTTGKPIHDLNTIQEKELRAQLTELTPVMHTPLSEQADDLKSGLLVAKSDRKLSTNPVYQNVVKFGTPFSDNGAKSTAVHGFEVTPTGPGVAMVPMGMHSFDGAVSHRADPKAESLNIHDARGAGVGGIKDVATSMNQATWDSLLTYSPAAQITAALLRTVHGLDALIKQGTVPAAVLSNLASSLVSFAEKQSVPAEGVLHLQATLAQAMAYKADSMKLDTMVEMQAVNQYAMEGGAYLVSTDNRSAAASLRSTLAVGLSASDQAALDSVAGKLDAAIKAELAKRDGKSVVVADPELDTAARPAGSVAELGKSKVASEPKLVEAFAKTPTMAMKQAVTLLRDTVTDPFGRKLLSALERSVGADVTIQYVTRDTVPAELAAKGDAQARGWYVMDANTIYVLAPEFKYSGLTSEMLLHELTHAALARTIEQAQKDGKGEAFALVQELEELMAKAQAYVTANGLDAQFGPALTSVHELVSWGMTNAEFQQQVLVKLGPMVSNNTGSKLMDGMKSFITILSALVFGRHNDSMTTGMDVLITNTAGLFNAAAKSRNEDKRGSLVLNQVNTGPSLRDLSTVDVFAALGQSNNGRSVSSSFAGHLEELLSGIVTKLHGPFGSFKAALMEQTAQTPDQVYQQALITGHAPFAFDLLGAGLHFTEQEAFVAEQVQVTVNAAVSSKDGVTAVAYRELAKLYDEVRSKTKVADFYKSAAPTTVEKAEAQALHDFIFGVALGADGRSEYLSRFAALGLAHEGFNTVLQQATSRTNRDTTGMSFNDRLNKIFEAILNWFSGKMTNTKQGQDADQKLRALVEQLVAIEARKRMVVKARMQLVSPIEDRVDGMAAAFKKQLEAFGKKPFFQQSTNGFVRAGGSFLSAYAGERTDAILEGFNRLRDQHFSQQHGIAAALVNEFRGSNAGNLAFHFLLRATKHIEGIRKDIITGTGKVVMGSFVNAGSDLTDDHKDAISAVFLRTELGSLLGQYTMADLTRFIADRSQVTSEISKLEAQFAGMGNAAKFGRYFTNAAKTLGYYKAVGKVTSAHMVMNAGNIARLYGTGMQTRISETEAKLAEPIIDALVSLYALAYSRDEHLANAQEVMKAEAGRTDGGNGVEMILMTHKALVEKSKEMLFDGAAPLHMKGYTTEIYDPFMAVVVANKDDGDELIKQGYTRGDQVQHDMADPLAEKKHIYYLRDGGLQRRVSGIFSTTNMKAKGARVHNGNLSPMSYSGQLNGSTMATIGSRKQSGIQAMFTATGFDPSLVTDQHLAPVLNANGDVVNYRYLMTERVKDNLLHRDNRPEKILGAMASNIYDKVSAKEQNRKAVTALHEQYRAEFAEKPESYMTVGPKSTDPQLREIWDLMPYSTKQAVKEVWGTEGMKVRVDLLDMNFGYRKLSVADAFDKDVTQRNFVEGMFVDLMTHAFHEKAALRTRQVEDIWQAVVKATKGNLVVKSWSTMSGNLRSNWSQLILMGVNPVAIARSHRVAFKGAWAYKKDSEEMFSLQHQLSTGYLQPGQTKAEIEHQIVRLMDSINRNPVKPLIDAGLMPTIVEDVAADDDIYSYKSIAVKKVEQFTAGFNPQVVGIAKFMLMTEDSSAFKVMSYATQISDFLARYTLYEYSTTKKDALSHEAAIQLASDAFINYDVPTHRMVQYANDSGLVMFTKYYMRIQKMLGKIYKEHPGRVMAMIAAEHMLGDQPTVLDSGMLKRWGNPMNLGALDYPGSLDSLTTVRLLSSPFRHPGNPNQ